MELLKSKKIRTKEIYKKGIFKGYSELGLNLRQLVERNLIKKTVHNKRNVTYELTPKGFNFIILIAVDENMFCSYVKDFLIWVDIGSTNPISLLFKNGIRYKLDIDGHKKDY